MPFGLNNSFVYFRLVYTTGANLYRIPVRIRSPTIVPFVRLRNRNVNGPLDVLSSWQNTVSTIARKSQHKPHPYPQSVTGPILLTAFARLVPYTQTNGFQPVCSDKSINDFISMYLYACIFHILYGLVCHENRIGDTRCAALLKRSKTTTWTIFECRKQSEIDFKQKRSFFFDFNSTTGDSSPVPADITFKSTTTYPKLIYLSTFLTIRPLTSHPTERFTTTVARSRPCSDRTSNERFLRRETTTIFPTRIARTIRQLEWDSRRNSRGILTDFCRSEIK